MSSTYTPVAYEYREVVEEVIASKRSGKVFFFDEKNKLDDAEGVIAGLEENSNGLFIVMNSGALLRLDRVITVLGKPGPAYDEYDAYGNVCLDCRGGYDL